MDTHIAQRYQDNPHVARMEGILRCCVHCGFCLATCPTYQLLGDERDSPRGRIYLIKALLEGRAEGRETQFHLDRCLTCRACETTCPSGVQYGQLVGDARQLLEHDQPRSVWQKIFRMGLKRWLSDARRFSFLMGLARLVRPLIPTVLRHKVPLMVAVGPLPKIRQARQVVFLAGCVQPVLRPSIQAAAMRILDALGISGRVSQQAGCCGALNHHLSDENAAMTQMKANIDAWWPWVQAGEVEAVITTASACGVEIRDYGKMLAHDLHYRDKAQRIADMTHDIGAFLCQELGTDIDEQRLALCSIGLDPTVQRGAVAFHAPCTLQHGLRQQDKVEAVLRATGVTLTQVEEAYLCCGSAGTYSILQPKLSSALRTRKLGYLQADQPTAIVSANLGCQLHLGEEAQVPVMHWVEWLDAQISADRLARV